MRLKIFVHRLIRPAEANGSGAANLKIMAKLGNLGIIHPTTVPGERRAVHQQASAIGKQSGDRPRQAGPRKNKGCMGLEPKCPYIFLP